MRNIVDYSSSTAFDNFPNLILPTYRSHSLQIVKLQIPSQVVAGLEFDGYTDNLQKEHVRRPENKSFTPCWWRTYCPLKKKFSSPSSSSASSSASLPLTNTTG